MDNDGDGYSDASGDWTVLQGADACPLIYGFSTADRVGCLDTDEDNYSDPTVDYGVEDGADAYPNDPTRWILEPEEETSLLAGSNALIGGGVGLVVALVLVGLIMRRRGKKKRTKHGRPPAVCLTSQHNPAPWPCLTFLRNRPLPNRCTPNNQRPLSRGSTCGGSAPCGSTRPGA